eukprot:CAMPEP_0174894398 /NCGR_PEP_ID=MMETSP0167-20121228/9039_1 /TAXON_ID=38298 /ORGANISM="Rhodella maculata, Strain CCMP736" /LENGTH=31 /DNA_ID= /DNA_START= /DNA_END= /DNA_ORIENTATION=
MKFDELDGDRLFQGKQPVLSKPLADHDENKV